jgi:hypothetical protein
MKMIQLYDLAGTWIGQFNDVDSLEAWAAEQNLDLNQHEIRMEKNKYP